MKLFANTILVGDSTYSQFGFKRFNVNLPMSYLTTANKLVMKYTPMNTNVANNEYDRYGIAYTELRYPRLFNFNNVDSYYVELDPKASDYYLEFSNFKNNGVAPKLYDITSKVRAADKLIWKIRSVFEYFRRETMGGHGHATEGQFS